MGIRVPDNPICQALLAEFGSPIISTSACLPDQAYLSDPDEIAETFARTADLFLDAGPGGLEPSTIVDLTGEEPCWFVKAKARCADDRKSVFPSWGNR